MPRMINNEQQRVAFLSYRKFLFCVREGCRSAIVQDRCGGFFNAQGGTGCCTTGGPKVREVLVDRTEALIAPSVTDRTESSASAVQS
jgi:hypothetical protein